MTADLAPPPARAPVRSGVTLLANALDGLEARHLADRLGRRQAPAILHVARDAPRIAFIEQVVRFFAPRVEIVKLPAWDCLPYDRISPNPELMAQRLEALAILAGPPAKRPRLILTSANALVQRVPPPEVVAAGSFSVRRGGKVSRDALIAWLERNGYRRSGTVVEQGEYAVRGGLLDLFPTGAATPSRLDLFGDVVDSIRAFDPLSQRSLDRVDGLTLRPMSEVLFDAEAIERFKVGYLQHFGAVTGDPLLEAISSGRAFPGMEHWLPLFHERLVTVFDYLPAEAELSLDHLAQDAVQARLALIGEHYKARREPAMAGTSFGSAPYRALPPELLYLDEHSLGQAMAVWPTRQFSIFAPPPSLPSGIARVEDLGGRPARNFARERADRSVNLFDAIVAHLRELTSAGHRPLLATYSAGSAERLRQILDDHGLEGLAIAEGWATAREAAGPVIVVLPLPHGFTAPDLCILGEQDLLGDRLQRGARRTKRADKFIAEVAALGEGDLVVHAEHGIGRFEGLETLQVGGAPHDCLKILYHGNDKLFVPVENIELLSRYGHADQEVQLDRLGGVGWQSRKARIKERIRELAGELIKVAAERATREAQPIRLPDGIYDEFAARFPHEETEDQLTAIEAVLEDMASGHPMDRLVCGDVGFGKTEVALRAAFACAITGKQVAVLAPTTLLARQHFQVFSERFQGLPIRVAQLSRFVSNKEANDTKKALAAGEVDVVVSTHAVLGKTVSFKDLGLVVIDEEQHFGVAHKERLKQLRAEVHVLTMTATPIPRTLHMALGGMKDLSIIATPPVDRLAVRTFVMPSDPVVIREALLREHYRGGQSFYVCPRISDQPKLLDDLQKLVPEVTIGVANGQMPASDLEEVMGKFYDRKLDLLIATNIIESGLDIPTANTLIVHKAHLFGLSQLYQLRGRVGRSKVRGYAYFTVPANQTLQDTAEKRLHVIQSLEGLGAGFQLASHDLDIRGAGNLLGQEQSGQIKEVGFELYNQMLDEAVAELKRTKAEEQKASTEWVPQITVDAAALMPESYIGDLDLRLSLYRRLAGLDDPADIESFAAELIDRFGPMPAETESLLQLVAVKQLCKRANVQKLDIGPKGVVLTFRENKFARPERLVGWIAESRGTMRVRPDHKLVLMKETRSPNERLRAARQVVSELARLAA
ncbi:MAG TPA: transcription-repair coupling factor [Geminicoccaceae bacterium]|nr:transcription-repair coupling factor [Geminicoccus sp.]HMU52796.1 transcription-repair coupling factor [Geminicoccaceae bacterium]